MPASKREDYLSHADTCVVRNNHIAFHCMIQRWAVGVPIVIWSLFSSIDCLPKKVPDAFPVERERGSNFSFPCNLPFFLYKIP